MQKTRKGRGMEIRSRSHSHGNILQHTATHCNTLQYTAIHCNTLQDTATCYNMLQHSATHSKTLRDTATRCNTVPHTATRCNTLQHIATRCNTLQHAATLKYAKQPIQSNVLKVHNNEPCQYEKTPIPLITYWRSEAMKHSHGNHLQYTVTHCNTLQHTATLKYTKRAINRERYICTYDIPEVHSNEPYQYERKPIHLLTLLRSVVMSHPHSNTLQHTATSCNTLQH